MNIYYALLYFLCVVCLCYFTYFLATDYQKNETRSHSPFFLWIIDTIDLFIHETGHFIFQIFGRFIGILGGSLFQISIPVVTVLVFAQSSLNTIPFTFYWTGQNMVNVSVYIGDAPVRQLHLISRSAIHDWHWLLNYTGMMGYAEDIAGGVNIVGLSMCCIGICIGFYFSIQAFIRFYLPR